MSYRDAIDVILDRIPEAITDFNGSTAIPNEGWLARNALDDGGYYIPESVERSLFTALFDYYFKQLHLSDIADIIRFIGANDDDKWYKRFVAILSGLPGGKEFRPTCKTIYYSNDYRWAYNMKCRERINFSQTVEITFTDYPYLKLGNPVAFNHLAERNRRNALRQLDNFSHREQSLGYCVGDEKLIEFFFEDEVTGMLFLVKNGDCITL